MLSLSASRNAGRRGRRRADGIHQVAGGCYDGPLEEFILGSSDARDGLKFAREFAQCEGDMDYEVLSLCLVPEDIPAELHFERMEKFAAKLRPEARRNIKNPLFAAWVEMRADVIGFAGPITTGDWAEEVIKLSAGYKFSVKRWQGDMQHKVPPQHLLPITKASYAFAGLVVPGRPRTEGPGAKSRVWGPKVVPEKLARAGTLAQAKQGPARPRRSAIKQWRRPLRSSGPSGRRPSSSSCARRRSL